MTDIGGTYDCVGRSPLGEQASTLVLVTDGDSFTGESSSAQGSLAIKNGRIEGKRLTWQMDISVPMAMTLDAEAIVEGDSLTGTVKLGPLGAATLTGTRRA
jgi:hypothetical protein